MTPSLAFLTTGESVLIFIPGPAGMAQEACGFGLFSTCRKRWQHVSADVLYPKIDHTTSMIDSICSIKGLYVYPLLTLFQDMNRTAMFSGYQHLRIVVHFTMVKTQHWSPLDREISRGICTRGWTIAKILHCASFCLLMVAQPLDTTTLWEQRFG